VRIRPFFWALFLLSCLSILALAFLSHPYAATLLQVHVERHHLVSHGLSAVYLQLTDSDGLAVSQANIKPSAHMTNMNMVTNQSAVSEIGNGHYVVQLNLYMTGLWAIVLQTQAEGFLSQRQTLFVDVT
jgi:YtkA-like